MFVKIFKFLLAVLAAVLPCASLLAAPVENLRVSVSPARIRFVLDSREAIAFTEESRGNVLTVSLPESSSRTLRPQVQDSFIRSAVLRPTGEAASELQIVTERRAQYKIYWLQQPERLVIDLYRINLIEASRELAQGVTYTYLQDEMNGRQVQAYAAVNTSYFDSAGWVIGNTKDRGMIFSAESTPRSAYADDGRTRMIVQDTAYTGRVTLPDGSVLYLKGMNRRRIGDDLVLFNEYYGRSTNTNGYGWEAKLKNGRVVAVSGQGNMRIEAGTQVLSGHGSNAAPLARLRVGDRVLVEESLGAPAADAAKILVSGGPLLLENGRVNVRSEKENIAPDIARGRAPRTAIGITRDGDVLVLVVDGRSQTSAGMTLEELAQFFLRLGAKDAVNLDGGGSSVMVINRKIVNRPSDGRERAVSMGLGLFPKR